MNGAIHWLALRVDGPDSSDEVIIAFDMAEESLNEVPMPDGFNDEFFGLIVLGGRLSLIDMNCCYATEIWMMEEYGVKSSWIKSITVSIDEGDFFFPICFTEGGEVLGIDGDVGLMKYNGNGEVTKHYEVLGMDATMYTEFSFSF